MVNEKFRVAIVGDLDYADLIADIYFEDQILVVLTQEFGFDNMQIELYPPKNQEFWNFKMSEFEEVLQYAKQRLWELRKNAEKFDNQK